MDNPEKLSTFGTQDTVLFDKRQLSVNDQMDNPEKLDLVHKTQDEDKQN